MKNEMENIYSVNCVLLGNSSVGKTSIIKRLMGKKFEEKSFSTIGIDSNYLKPIDFKNKEDNSKIIINLIDTAGQERFRSLSYSVVRKADIIIFVRDKNEENFEFWFNFVKDLIDINSIKIFYCLNKTDLISPEEMEDFNNDLIDLDNKQKHNASIHLVSSKSFEGILNLKNSIIKTSQEIVFDKYLREKYIVKIILIGPSGVGKSSLIERIINDNFSDFKLSPIRPEKKLVKVDLKNHSSINYQYIDTSGQEKYLPNLTYFLDSVDIIIFVNDKNQIKALTSIVEKKILLSDKIVICCINKMDLFSDGELEPILAKYKLENEELKDKPIFVVSAQTSEGIKELKDKVNDYSINIIKKIIASKNDRKDSFRLNKDFNKKIVLNNKKKKCSC